MESLTTPWGELKLTRFPENPRDQFRAWDSADEYLLDQLADGDDRPTDLGGETVVLGDRWGALTAALAGRTDRLTQITDSYLTQQATRANLERNGIDPESVRLCSTQDTPPARIDTLLVRVPKTLALLEDQLHRLAPGVHAGTVVIGTGRTTEIHTSTLRLFERILGPTRTSLAVRKSRLIHCTPDPALARPANPWPQTYQLPADAGVLAGLTVVDHAGVFSAARLDPGTRMLLAHLPKRSGSEHVVDLGCGNGVLGLAAALGNPATQLTLIDESYQAVASAERTFGASATGGAARFVVGDGLTEVERGSVDLVLNNPPFHTHQATSDATAWQMFTEARRALRPGGELWVVGNRHLGYHAKLKRLFGNCEQIGGDRRFVVLRAVRTVRTPRK